MHAYQFHDSSEQNGAFKSNWYKEKDLLIQWKANNGYKISLGKTDIIPLLNRAVTTSFGNTNNAKKALSARGWNPLNYFCLTLPEVTTTKQPEPTAAGVTTGSVDADSNSSVSSTALAAAAAPRAGIGSAVAPVNTLNTDSGMALTVMDQLVDHHNINAGREKRRLEQEENRRQNQAASDAFQAQTKGLKGGIPTGGSWYREGQVGLNQDALAIVEAKHAADRQKADEKENQKKRELWELKIRVDGQPNDQRDEGSDQVQEEGSRLGRQGPNCYPERNSYGQASRPYLEPGQELARPRHNYMHFQQCGGVHFRFRFCCHYSSSCRCYWQSCLCRRRLSYHRAGSAAATNSSLRHHHRCC